MIIRKIAVSETIPAGGKIEKVIETNGYKNLAITIKATYASTARLPVYIEAYFSSDNTNYDTDSDFIFIHPFKAGETRQKTYVIPSPYPYVKLVIKNNDTANEVTVDAWYALW